MKDGHITPIGNMVSKLPTSVQAGRMIIEAQRFGVVEDVITIAAILAAGSIRDRSDNWRAHTQETESDLVAELDLWYVAQGRKSAELRDLGVFSKSYWRAKEIRQKLIDALRGKVDISSNGNKELIRKSVVAGMVDHLFTSDGCGRFSNGGYSWTSSRQVAKESVVSSYAEMLVGEPKDIQFKDKS